MSLSNKLINDKHPSSNNGDFSKQGRDFGAFNNSKIDKPRFEAQPDQIPPQNLEAEESVLGGILLDPDAIGRIADLLQVEAFYTSAHREIYRTALMLHSQGKPTDLTAMSALAGRYKFFRKSWRQQPIS